MIELKISGRSSFKNWDFGFNTANPAISKEISQKVDVALREDPPLVRMDTADPDKVKITVGIFGDEQHRGGPILQFKLSHLIDDFLSYADDNETGITRLRNTLEAAIRKIDRGWPPLG